MAITVIDNRATCTSPVPSACVPYTGYVSDSISDALPCKPNVNDVIAQMQDLIDKMYASRGDNTSLDILCLPDTLDVSTATQKDINQAVFTLLCQLQTTLSSITGSSDANNLSVTIDLSCLQDPSCTPQTSYTLITVLTKLVLNYCDLNTRTTRIEQLLNI